MWIIKTYNNTASLYGGWAGLLGSTILLVLILLLLLLLLTCPIHISLLTWSQFFLLLLFLLLPTSHPHLWLPTFSPPHSSLVLFTSHSSLGLIYPPPPPPPSYFSPSLYTLYFSSLLTCPSQLFSPLTPHLFSLLTASSYSSSSSSSSSLLSSGGRGSGVVIRGVVMMITGVNEMYLVKPVFLIYVSITSNTLLL